LDNKELIINVLLFIDENIHKKITIEALSKKFHYSQFHFHRIFSAYTNMSATAYIRKRKLEFAFEKISESKESISSICYNMGFESIQTFNRAFKELFNTTPSAIRKNSIKINMKSIQDIITGYQKKIKLEGVFAMEPKFVNREAFILAGIRKHTKDGFHVIGETWGSLKERILEIKNRINDNIMYGFEDYSEDFNHDPIQFYYMAAVEVSDDSDLPDGISVKRLPAAQYAVFTVNGNNSIGEIGQAFRYIYDSWLPQSEYCLSDEIMADFEYYDERWDCGSSTSQLDIYIPVIKMNEK